MMSAEPLPTTVRLELWDRLWDRLLTPLDDESDPMVRSLAVVDVDVDDPANVRDLEGDAAVLTTDGEVRR